MALKNGIRLPLGSVSRCGKLRESLLFGELGNYIEFALESQSVHTSLFYFAKRFQ